MVAPHIRLCGLVNFKVTIWCLHYLSLRYEPLAYEINEPGEQNSLLIVYDGAAESQNKAV